ncbi:XRE family transcriptional regulator [Paenibacillus sp. 1011MAR3C5]|uniref:helix-turn-helix domain-containing protein n=1 Tax=Paenibacillus sp. 1011MAR3C5 TaxID=1675787 RepID=UPI000E6C7BF5|nr:helix-turn-helix transcriptional regulator [Paenibacillus sp. 1011MAR3C5]RJE90629.1 XRE family transcriptional regulator [Paenibacillus sp. 1011MAR3C5]
MTKFPTRLLEARMKSTLTLNQVSEATGVDVSIINRLETGEYNAEPIILCTLASLYGVSADWLIGSINNPDRTLSENEKAAAAAIRSYDLTAFLEQPFVHNGKPLNREAKKKLYVMAQLLLDQDE